MRAAARILLSALLVASAGCTAAENGNSNTDAGSTSDVDTDTDSDSDSDSDPFVDLHGTVLAPSEAFPIPGALVYLTGDDAPQIPDEAYCYDCEDMDGKSWTLSNADGTWTIEGVLPGTYNIVTRKGFFQRQRELLVTGDESQEVPTELTKLPGEASSDGFDQIPSYAIALNGWDRPHTLLAKLGMGQLSSSGELAYGTERFDIYNDVMFVGGYPDSSELYESLEEMTQYHMIFMPCTSGHLKEPPYEYLNPPGKLEQIGEYVAAGGKLYGTCYAYDWIEQPFHEYVEFPGDDDVLLDALHSYWGGGTIITDEALRDWLAVVTPIENPDNFQVTGAFVHAEYTNDIDDGMGLEEDDWWVKPKTWVTTYNGDWDCGPDGCPMTVTYNYGCGKVFFSAYHVVDGASTPEIRPQEYILLYLILEVGVCEGDYGVE